MSTNHTGGNYDAVPFPTEGPNIGYWCLTARQTANMTQEQWARAVGVSTVTVGRIERGISAPRLETVWSMWQALNERDLRVPDPTIATSVAPLNNPVTIP